ncbi:MAG: hypothetical protein KKC76_03800 [Proteobacteria bacterium]|nr:hypothetical protein [Pseudomonadota bacterium]MBU4294475.1 hypothetical protein [Pseudomonadota bacterium]MCG2749182.1 hypothetical protein [Desulfobulbaceae bacterium]
MKGMIPETKVQVKERSTQRTAVNAPAKVEVSRGVMIGIGAIPTVIGIWAAACFFGGLIASGGPLALVKSWFSAFTGM